MSHSIRRLALPTLALPILLAACAGAGGTVAPASPTPPATSTPAPSLEVAHATAATSVVLRKDTGGGFVAPGFLLTEVPEFTLYGDGTIVYRDPAATPPTPLPDGASPLTPFRTARLTEDAVQALLKFALGPSGLGVARSEYPAIGIADAGETSFTVAAGGVEKTVRVGALGFTGGRPGPDDAARAAFVGLADRLDRIGSALGGPSQTYRPAHFRGFLSPVDGVAGATIAWPWTAFGPAGFTEPTGGDAVMMPRRLLTADDVAKLGLGGLEGGAQGIPLAAPTGSGSYDLTLRPLLPDENP
jgi:hypothetical protein